MIAFWVVTIGEVVHVVRAKHGAEAVEAACAIAESPAPPGGLYFAQATGDNRRFAYAVARETVFKAVPA